MHSETGFGGEHLSDRPEIVGSESTVVLLCEYVREYPGGRRENTFCVVPLPIVFVVTLMFLLIQCGNEL